MSVTDVKSATNIVCAAAADACHVSCTHSGMFLLR